MELAGKYRVIAQIGGGGMAEVFLAVARGSLGDFHKLVVIKVLRPTLGSEDLVPMFLDEARLTARLNHPNVVQTHDVGHDDGRYYISMEFLEGESYESIRHHPQSAELFPQRMRLRMLARVLRGLHYAHELLDYDGKPLRVVHRDVTPSNVFVTFDGQVKLVDFGIAKACDSSTHTRTGLFKGKVRYMAPEQMYGESVDRRADIYSVGVMLWEVITGTQLWKGVKQSEIMQSVLAAKLPAPSQVTIGVPEQLERICMRALAHSPEDRYPTAAAFEEDIEAYLSATAPSCGDARLGAAIGAMFGTQRAAMRETIERQLAQSTSSQWGLALPPAPASEPSRPGTASRAGLSRASLADASSALTPGGIAIAPRRFAFAKRGTALAGAAFAAVAALTLVGARSASPGKGAGAAARREPTSIEVPEATPRASVRGVTDTEVVLGMSAAFSGPAREYGRRMKLGMEAAFAAQNTRGGVAGRKLTLVSLDDGYDSKRVGETMRQLIDERNVFAIVGNTGTATSAVAAPYAVSKKTVFFGALSGSNVLRRDPADRYVFNYRPSYQEETARMVRYLVDVKKISPDGIVVFAQKDAFGDAGFEGAAKALRRYGRSDGQLFRTGYERNTLDVDAGVNDIVRYSREAVAGPNETYRYRHPVSAVLVVATHKPAAKFIQRLAEKDIHPILLATSGSTGVQEELKEAGALRAARGLVMTQIVPHYESGGTGIIRYREALAAFHPDEQPDAVSLEGYVVGTLFAEGVRRAGRDLDTEKLVEALESTRDLDLQIGSILSFGPSEHQASHKVWGTVLDEEGAFRPLDLE
jgi:ABC-type branched-subunit amino acid transport system substrate-binding protein